MSSLVSYDRLFFFAGLESSLGTPPCHESVLVAAQLVVLLESDCEKGTADEH